MRTVEGYLVVNAEIAFRVRVKVRSGIGWSFMGDIDLEMPDVPVKLVETGVIHLEPDEEADAADA